MSGAGASESVVLYGAAEREPEAMVLTAGGLSAELFVAGNLRDIRFDGVEVIRAVGYIVRDEDWGTYAPVLSNLETRREAGSFRVTYEAQCRAADGAALTFSATIIGGL
jgi:D-apionolactonase